MTVFTWDVIQQFADGSLPVPAVFKQGTAVTIGSFDGPHRGHDALFDAVLHASERTGLIPGIITFTRPLSGLKNPAAYQGDVSTLAQRLGHCADKGIAFAVVIDFSDEFGRIEGRVFLSMLQSVCGMKFLAEGRDFHCGYHGATDMDDIRALSKEKGFELEIVDPVMYGGERISSSRIRQDILFGDFGPAGFMLSHPYRLDCTGFNWFYEKQGDTVLLSAEKSLIQVLPSDGVYNVVVIMSGSRSFRNAAPAAETAEHTYRTSLTVEPQILRLQVSSDNAVSNVRAIEFISATISEE